MKRNIFSADEVMALCRYYDDRDYARLFGTTEEMGAWFTRFTPERIIVEVFGENWRGFSR